MWEKRIFHPGLKTFRVIRGAEQATVELKAKLQTDIWDERWQKIQLANSKRQKEDEVAKARFQQKELALQRTREAEKQLDSLTCILRDGIEIDHVLDWEQLKDKASFSEPKPEQPQHLSSSPPPLRGSAEFLPQLSLVDRLVPSRRSRRIAEAERRYQDAIDKWNVSEKRHRETIASQQSAYEEKLKEWTSKKTLHAIALAGQHAEVDATKVAYEARQLQGLVEYWSHVLFATEYPEGFPKSFVLDYDAGTQTVVVEYELPDIECLPRRKELKYIAARDEFREVTVSDTWLNKTYDDVLYQICLRTVHEVFQSDTLNATTSVVFNGWVNYVDKSTGQEVNSCILSLQVTKAEFAQLNLAQVEPKACFRSLKGISGSKLSGRSAVRPILQLNKQDKRFVPSHDVAYELDDSFNLAAMDWLDFENRFEKYLRRNSDQMAER